MDYTDKYPCPCCGYLVFGKVHEYDICRVCGWEDDLSQLKFVTMSGANMPLIEAQKKFAEKNMTAEYPRDPNWRPLDPDKDTIEIPQEGVDYGDKYPDDDTELYYWNKDHA